MRWPRLLVAGGLVLALLWATGPREPSLPPAPAVELPADLGGWLALREADARPGTEARIDWAGAPGARTDLALVYLHGFSGSPAELRPLPQEVAAELGANLFSQRLTGHGQSGAALAGSSLADWWRDTAEAVAIGQRLGRRVVVIGLSTGATLAAEAALDPDIGPGIDAVVLISPNFAVRHRWAWMLELPYARALIRVITQGERCFEARNEEHASGWTACYGWEAALPMAALLRHARGLDYEAARQPALFIWSDADVVVRPDVTRRIAARWGGEVTELTVTPGPRDDPSAHVIAGDALSPDLSAMLSGRIAMWIAAESPRE